MDYLLCRSQTQPRIRRRLCLVVGGRACVFPITECSAVTSRLGCLGVPGEAHSPLKRMGIEAPFDCWVLPPVGEFPSFLSACRTFANQATL